MTISAPATLVTVERTIKATPQQIYRAFTTRDELNVWFCDNSFVQLQANGAYLYIWNAEKFTATGIIKQLEENKSLELTWRSTWEGNTEPADSIFSITIAENGNQSTVTLTHSDITEDGAEGYEWQWNKRLDDLKQYLETGGQPNIINRVIIGIWPAALPKKRADELGLKENFGTLVTNIVPNYSAEKAGIQINDVIVALDDTEVGPDAPMNVVVQGKKPGDEINVTFFHGDEKVSKRMTLMGYPVPAIPENMAALADNMAAEYEQVYKELAALFDGVSEEAAGKRPAEGEWSAKLVLAHLIYGERWNQDVTGGRIVGGQPQHWSGNHDARLQAILDVYPTVSDLLGAFHEASQERIALWRNFPKDIEQGNLNAVWGEAFAMDGGMQHTRFHYNQIQEAIAAAK
jgi:uncharacterized protein YndB with AHSA1/START domain